MEEEKNTYEAKFNAIEDDLAEFVFKNTDNEISEALNNSFYLPAKKVPNEIEPGDEVLISLNLKNREEKMEKIKEKREQELKNAQMRKMLEELVN